MILAQLWRYPVKSMAGESLAVGTLRRGTLVGDRGWGVFDLASGRLMSAKRWPTLLAGRATYDDASGVTQVGLPDGSVGVAGEAALDARLSTWLGRAVALRQPSPNIASTIEVDELDLGGDPALPVRATTSFTTEVGQFFDSRSGLHATTMATADLLARGHGASAADLRRYRANLVLDGSEALAELAWVGLDLVIAGVPLHVRKRTERCVLVTRAQRGLPEDRPLLRYLATEHAACVGVYLDAPAVGCLTVGDLVSLAVAS